MELSNDPAVFQHYIRLTSPYHDSTRLGSALALPPRVDTRAANVLFAGATRGRCRSASDLSRSLSARELVRLMTDDDAARDVIRNIFLFVIRTSCRKHFVLLNRH